VRFDAPHLRLAKPLVLNNKKMERICLRCNSNKSYEVPLFSTSEKEELLLKARDSSIKTVKTLINEFKVSHATAKFIRLHINVKYGKYNQCNFSELNKEYVNCPKCNALNFNWKVDMSY
jgi:hypothetical protein